MKKTGIMFVIVTVMAMLFSVINVSAKQLKWTSVESTEDCVIAGYLVMIGTVKDVYRNSQWVKEITWNGEEINVGNVLSYDLDDLEEDVTHCLMVRAYSEAGEKGPYSDYVTFHPTSTPAKVENVAGFNDGVDAIATWTPGDKPCKLYYGLFSGQYFVSENFLVGVGFYQFPYWTVNYTLYFKVVMIDEYGRESSEANEVVLEPLAIPEEVQGTTAIDDGNFINVSWDFSSKYVDNYKIYWSFFPGSYLMEPIIVSNIENFVYLTRYGITTYVKVVGCNSSGESVTWQEVEVQPYTTPFKITGVEVRKNPSGELYVTWDFALDAVDGYRVYSSFWIDSFPMAPKEVAEVENVAFLPSYYSNYSGTIYVYVVAYNALGESVEKIFIPLVPTELVPDS